MPIVMKVLIQQTNTGVSTHIEAAGPCTEAEGELATFIHKTLVAALESRKGYRSKEEDICEIKAINMLTDGNKFTH
ncbi:Uncharacterised protein [Cedecea neteri]|uniref:Uncharacterized protein n=1 Tax=Cedecea neteri TaxID=158822 RepID=A0A291DXE0_9ENTR|nr:hypothetical protein [Cedecea neteri]ATF92383.1 hypothetical protein CO704_09940 [Cedecea neteri]SQC92556.1 Uncharacterised protein [Cedecea neteri]